jgi:2-octaprenyl-6-methoxyphenol hydroxylase
LRVGRRQAYPLFLLKAREHARARVAIIGNAAHTLHPIAGQGFNLGIRDVAALAEVIADARRSGQDIGDLVGC